MSNKYTHKEVQLSVKENGICRVMIDYEKVAEISPNGDIITFVDTQRANQTAALHSGPFIGEDFKTASMYGTSVTAMADDTLLVIPKGTVRVRPPSKRPPALGQRTKEGIYIGRFRGKSGEKKDWYADISDIQDSNGSRLSLDFNVAATEVKNLRSLGFDNWILPPGQNDVHFRPDIQKGLFDCRNTGAFEDTFDETILRNEIGSDLTGYWSGSTMGIVGTDNERAMIQVFGSGHQSHANKSKKFFVRAVRSVNI